MRAAVDRDLPRSACLEAAPPAASEGPVDLVAEQQVREDRLTLN
jgi:hypothetical protein